MTSPTPAPVFLDCDTGIDDALALAYLLAEPTVELVGVATVSGNVDATQGARNTLDLLHLAGCDDVPVAVGEIQPMVGKYTGAVPYIHGANGVGDVVLPRAERSPVAATGPELLITAARKHPGALRVVAIAPLTNLATALQLEPELPTMVHSVTIMGGAMDTEGNVTPVAEANIWNDPEAAKMVLDAGWSITLVPLDVTKQHVLTEPDRQRLLGSDDVLLHSLGQILDLYFDFYVTKYGERMCALHDPLAAVIAADAITTVDDIVTGSLDVALTGDERGRTIHTATDDGGPIRVVLSTVQDVAPLLMDKLTAWRDAAALSH